MGEVGAVIVYVDGVKLDGITVAFLCYGHWITNGEPIVLAEVDGECETCGNPSLGLCSKEPLQPGFSRQYSL